MPYLGNSHIAGDQINNFKVLDDISSHTSTFDGSASGVVSISDNTIRIPEHRFVQGQRVTYNNGGGGNIGNLSSGTAYYIIKDTNNTIKLATSLSNANSSTEINLSVLGSGSSHTLNVAFDGVNTKFKITHNGGTSGRINNATQLSLAINNVIQRPNQNAITFTEGFAIEDQHKIVFKVAPVSSDIFWGSILANTLPTFDITDNKIDNFTGDGSTTEFNLSNIPASNKSIMVTINGVLQHPSDGSTSRSYTLLANILQFTAAPGNGDEIQVRHIGFAGASTSDVTGFYGRTGNVVLTSNDHITTGNINAGVVTATTFVGNLTGNVSGNLTVGGVLTYEDVTNVDSIGIITARSGFKVLAGGANVVGVITARTNIHLEDYIHHLGDLTTKIGFPAANTFTVDTAGDERLRINSTGQLLHGHNASIGYGRNFETSSTSGYGGIAINRFSDDTGSGGLDFVKSRNASLGGNTIVQSDDNLGAITWKGADGTDFTTPAAQIKVAVDGTPGENDMPGRIMFYTTADGASSVSERLRITSDGNVIIAENMAVNRPRIVLSAPDDGTNYRHLFGANLQVDSSGTFTTPTANISGGGWEYLAQNSINQHGEIRYLSAPDTNATSSTPLERFRIDSSGNLIIPGNSSVKDISYGDGSTTGYFRSTTNVNRTSADQSIHMQQFRWNNTKVAEIKVITGDDTTNKDNAHIVFETANSGTTAERLRIASDGMITLGNPTNTVLKAEVCNSVSGHYFVSQCDDNNNGFEIYQQHGSTSSRNTLAVYDNRSGAKTASLLVRGDGRVAIGTDTIPTQGQFFVGVQTSSNNYVSQPTVRFAVEPASSPHGDASAVHIGQRGGGSADPAIIFHRRSGSTAWQSWGARIHQGDLDSIKFSLAPAALPGSHSFTDEMIIKRAAGVGINTDKFYDSSTRLEVRGRINTVGSASTGSLNYGNGTVVNVGSLSPHNLQLMTGNSTRILLENGTGTAVTLKSSGEMGVNTNAPVEKLGISGNMRFVNPNGTTSRITALPSGSYNTGTSGGSAICFQRIADGGGGSDEIFFETHWQGNRHGESCRINKFGNLAFPSGQGIDFSATANGGTNQNELLDDYEEGDWQPTVSNGGANWSTTGRYTKVGRMVTIQADITNTSGSGTTEIHNLPFVVDSKYGTWHVGYAAVNGTTTSGNTNFTGGLIHFQGNGYLRARASGGTTNITMGNNHRVIFTGTYYTVT